MLFGLGIVLGIVLGALVLWAVFASRTGAQRAQLRASRDEVAKLSGERDVLRTEVDANRSELATLKASNEALVQARTLEQGQLSDMIANVTNEVVTKGTARLTELAAERLEIVTSSLKQNMELQDQKFSSQVDPLRELLDKYREQVSQLEVKREGAYQAVTQQLEQLKATEALLQKETRSLVTALRSPNTRGRWGEIQLQRVVEMAGMVEHCDFFQQTSTTTDDGVQRPDMRISLPDGAQIIVDSKVPLDAYLRYIEEEDDELRKVHLKDHARQLRTHIDTLSKKAYWKQFEPASPEFVVCFVPGEALLAAAFEADPTLIDQAMNSKVLLTGPTNLIALLKTVGLGWRHEALADNARDIQAAGRELYERLGTFAGHLAKVGRSLNSSVDSYNKAVGSLESRVLPSARRFEQLGVLGEGGDEVDAPTPIDGLARSLDAPEVQNEQSHPRLGSGHGDLHLVEPTPHETPTRD